MSLNIFLQYSREILSHENLDTELEPPNSIVKIFMVDYCSDVGKASMQAVCISNFQRHRQYRATSFEVSRASLNKAVAASVHFERKIASKLRGVNRVLFTSAGFGMRTREGMPGPSSSRQWGVSFAAVVEIADACVTRFRTAIRARVYRARRSRPGRPCSSSLIIPRRTG